MSCGDHRQTTLVQLRQSRQHGRRAPAERDGGWRLLGLRKLHQPRAPRQLAVSPLPEGTSLALRRVRIARRQRQTLLSRLHQRDDSERHPVRALSRVLRTDRPQRPPRFRRGPLGPHQLSQLSYECLSADRRPDAHLRHQAHAISVSQSASTYTDHIHPFSLPQGPNSRGERTRLVKTIFLQWRRTLSGCGHCRNGCWPPSAPRRRWSLYRTQHIGAQSDDTLRRAHGRRPRPRQ